MKRRDLEAPAACRLLSEARRRFTLSVAQSPDGCSGGSSSAHRNQRASCLEDPQIAWSWLTRPNQRPALDCSIPCKLHLERHLLAASEAGRSARSQYRIGPDRVALTGTRRPRPSPGCAPSGWGGDVSSPEATLLNRWSCLRLGRHRATQSPVVHVPRNRRTSTRIEKGWVFTNQ